MNLRKQIFLLSCFIHLLAIGQFNNFKFESLGTADGLSSSTCLTIFQDNEGFLWFGTIDGLNKYDGYGFEIYKTVLEDTLSISSNRINAIEEDAQGNLWVGTNNGLNYFNKKTNNFSRIRLDKQISVSNTPLTFINDLLYDATNNTLWVATNKGVIRVALAATEHPLVDLDISYYFYNDTNLNSIDDNHVNVIIKDSENVIWVGTNGQYLNRYHPERDNFDRIAIKSKGNYELNHIPKKVFVDADDDLWIGNDLSNLIFWDRKKNIFEHRSFTENHVPVRDIYLDDEGLLWCSTDGNGLFVLDKNGLKVRQHFVNNFSDPFSIPNDKPSKIYRDRDGIFWIGSYDKGVSKLDLSQHSFGHYYYQPDNPKGLNAKIVQSILQDSNGNIWIGAYNGGLNFFDEEQNAFEHFDYDPNDPNTISSNKILYTFETHDGNIWVCTLDGGLNKFNPGTKAVKRFQHNSKNPFSIGQNSVWSGVEDAEDRLWLGLRTEGLSLFDPKTKKFFNFKNSTVKDNGLASNFVFFLFIDSQNRLLVGTSLGLNYVHLDEFADLIPENIQFSEINEPGIAGTLINDITEDHFGNIWLGTDTGIHKLDQDLKLLKSYSTRDGLPNDLVVGIQEDDRKNIWVSTKSGLSLLKPETDQFKNFNVHDGLQGPEYQSKSIEKTNDGRILVGGINGFNIFNPADIDSENSVALTPMITHFTLNNKPIMVGDTVNGRVLIKKPLKENKSLRLKYDENYIAFKFLALYFENPEQVQYAYTLHGLENNFETIGKNREVNYPNLVSGDYIFELKASSDGQWENAPSVKFAFEILPPPWKTWWAYLLYSVFIIVFFSLILWYYAQKFQEAQTRELDQMKFEFFINVSHELKTPLTLILNPVEKILSNFNTNSKIVNTSAISIQRSARRLLHLVNQLLDYRKLDVGMVPLQLEKGDIVKFSEDIFSLFIDLATKKEIDYRFISRSNGINALFDSDKLEKIITNLISNAIKFTNVGGEITVSVNQEVNKEGKSGIVTAKNKGFSDYIEIIVKDSGIGLKEKQLKNIFTRFYHLDVTETGTGIGLNFTKALVESHGGEIAVESQHGIGSTFTVRIPLDRKAKPDYNVKNIKNEFLINSMKTVEYEMSILENKYISREEPQKDSIIRKPLILLVEDNKELRLHLRNDLLNEYEVKEAKDGVEGLEIIDKHHPDLIISDIIMPQMDGFEMCKRLKDDFETCHIPILLLTAKSSEDDRVDGYNSGADGYLSKPFVTGVLKARVQNLLKAKKRLRKRFAQIGGIFPASEVTSNNMDELFLDKATKIILDHIADVGFKQEHLLKELGLGRSQFYRKINSITGNNPSHFIRTIRLRYAADLLQKNSCSIKEVTYRSGFNSTAYFSKTFKELFNVTPTEFVEKNRKKKEIAATE